MAVNAGQRNVPDTPANRALDACEKARLLAIHTIKICTNRNIFLPQYDSALTDKIVAMASEIYTDAYGANSIKVDKDRDRWHERHALQVQAANKCNRLLAQIQLAKTLFHLKSKKVKYWGELTIDTRNHIQKWKDGDVERYGCLDEPTAPRDIGYSSER